MSAEAISLQRALPGDLAQVTHVIQASMQDAYPNPALGIYPDQFDMSLFVTDKVQHYLSTQLTQSENYRSWVATRVGQVIGVLTTKRHDPHDREPFVEFLKFHVLPDQRGKGIGGLLMHKGLHEWSGMGILLRGVLHYNNAALCYYKGLGFRINDVVRFDDMYTKDEWPVAHIPNYWAYQMWREPGSAGVQ